MTILYLFPLNALAMMSSGGGAAAALPWTPSAFDARFSQPALSKAVVQNHTQQPVLIIVFDMDETLLWQRGLRIYRPGMMELVIGLRADPRIKLILWTAAIANLVPNELKPYFHQIWTRDNWPGGRGDIKVKDLTRLGENMQRIIMFDNCMHAIKFNPEIAVLVHGFHGPESYDLPPNPAEPDFTASNINKIVHGILAQSHDMTVENALKQLVGHHIETFHQPLSDGWNDDHVQILVKEGLFHDIPPHGKFMRVRKEAIENRVGSSRTRVGDSDSSDDDFFVAVDTPLSQSHM